MIYIYTQCNFVNYIEYELGFSVIKGKELPEFIKNYGDDICIFRDYSNIKKSFYIKD